MAGEKPKTKCPDCAHPIDMHVTSGVFGVHAPGGCHMLRRPQKDELRLVECECPRTPDTFLEVAR